jgi:hypothetical protein
MIAPTTLRRETVRIGSLDMPAKAEHDFELASHYLSTDSAMRAILERAEHERRAIHLAINARDDDSFDPRTRTVNWDPHSALSTTEGGRQSPALGLGHELDHAIASARLRERGAATFDPNYDNAEERRVITGSEMHAATTLGEDIRFDHGGGSYRVATPIER